VDAGDGINREQEPSRQLHEWCGSDRRRNREEVRKQRVEHGKSVWIRHNARDLDDAGKAAPGVLEHGYTSWNTPKPSRGMATPLFVLPVA
jgi:hypothetical protein